MRALKGKHTKRFKDEANEDDAEHQGIIRGTGF